MEPKKTKVLSWEGEGVAPHAQAFRLELYNTTDRAYRVVHLDVSYERSAVATEPGVVRMYFMFIIGSGGWIKHEMLRYTGNVLHDRGSFTLPNPITFWKNDRIRFYTSDTSIGGAVDYRIVLVYEVI